MSVIPQQPVLFSGTLKHNLAPLGGYSDEQYWEALEAVQLRNFVVNNPDGLSMPIAEAGSNLSIGQCQLICIARAILKKSKILLIDEATANVDQRTDDIIQMLIKDRFKDRTVLTIAHRLITVENCDLIVELNEGMIVKFDRPDRVLPYYH